MTKKKAPYILLTLLSNLCFSIVLWFPFYDNGIGKSVVLKLHSDKFASAYADTNILKPYAPLLKWKLVPSSHQNFTDNLNKYEACLLNQGIKIFLLWIGLFIWYIHTFDVHFNFQNLLLSQGWNVEVYNLLLLQVFCYLFLTAWYLLLLLLYLLSHSLFLTAWYLLLLLSYLLFHSFLFLFWFFVIHRIAKNQRTVLLLDVHYVYENMLTA